MATWGLSATILAPAPDILRFAAHHIELGAKRLYLYLDDDNLAAFNALKPHPKVRVQMCDAQHWSRLGRDRPAKHQVRQTRNATHAYGRKPEVDWLIHMDVDEFLVPNTSVSGALSTLGPDTTSARVRPMELLGDSDDAYKAFIPPSRLRRQIVDALYPSFGTHLKGGFLSHVAGKLFVRTGVPDVSVRIHNAFQGDTMLPDATELADIVLAHRHATSWSHWRATYAYRLDKGSYRAELKPATGPENGGLTLHDLFQKLYAKDGEDGLRAFYDEVIGDSADLRARLDAQGVLRIVPLDLEKSVSKHFPETAI